MDEGQFEVNKDKIILVTEYVLAKIKRNRIKLYKKAIRKEMSKIWPFKAKTVKSASKRLHLKNTFSLGSMEWHYHGWREEEDARMLLRACKSSCNSSVFLSARQSAFINREEELMEKENAKAN